MQNIGKFSSYRRTWCLIFLLIISTNWWLQFTKAWKSRTFLSILRNLCRLDHFLKLYQYCCRCRNFVSLKFEPIHKKARSYLAPFHWISWDSMDDPMSPIAHEWFLWNLNDFRSTNLGAKNNNLLRIIKPEFLE